MAKMKWERKGNLIGCLSGKFEMGLWDLLPVLHYNPETAKEIWESMDEVGQECFAYGFKQKMSDAIARNTEVSLTDAEKKITFDGMYKQLTVDREWTKKARALTPIEKAENAVTRIERDIAEMISGSEAVGIPRDKAEELADKLYGAQLAKAKDDLRALKGTAETKLRKNGK